MDNWNISINFSLSIGLTQYKEAGLRQSIGYIPHLRESQQIRKTWIIFIEITNKFSNKRRTHNDSSSTEILHPKMLSFLVDHLRFIVIFFGNIFCLLLQRSALCRQVNSGSFLDSTGYLLKGREYFNFPIHQLLT